MKSLISIVVLLAAPSLASACDLCSTALVQHAVVSPPQFFVQPQIVAPIIVPEIVIPQVILPQVATVVVRDRVLLRQRVRVINCRAPVRQLLSRRRNVVRQRVVVRGVVGETITRSAVKIAAAGVMEP